jgi:hypothetical protein
VRAADRREAYRRDGAVSMKGWLIGSCRLEPADATVIVSTGRRLEQLPATAAAFASGDITATHARVISKAMTPRRVAKAAAADIDLAEIDCILAELARETGPEETGQGVARWVAGVDPDGALDDAAGTRRRFTMASGLDGRVHLRGELDAAGGEYLHTALSALMNGDRPAGDTCGHAERQADALVALARGALDGDWLPDVRGEPARAGHHRLAGSLRRARRPRRRRRRAGLGRADHPGDGAAPGVRRQRRARHHRAERAAPRRRPRPADGHRGGPPGRGGPRWVLRLRWL